MADTLPHPHAVITSIISQLENVAFSTSHEAHSTTLSSLRQRDQKIAKLTFIAIHFLFPHELLPALDILDRKLVTQLIVRPTLQGNTVAPMITRLETLAVNATRGTAAPSNAAISGAAIAATASPVSSWEVFYVQSASVVTSTSSTSRKTSKYRKVLNPSSTYYEVNLETWNCTCPAFAYSAFGDAQEHQDRNQGKDGDGAEAIGPDDAQDQGNDEKDDHNDNTAGPHSDVPHRDSSSWQFGGTTIRGESTAPICKHILAATLGKALPGFFGDGVKKKEVSVMEVAGWGAGWGD